MIETQVNINNHGLNATPSWDRAPARIKVVGIGGGGCNCVRRMLTNEIPGIQFVMVNTDIKSLQPTVPGTEIVQIGVKSTHGWGAGGDTKMGELAAQESETEIRNALKNAEFVF